MKTIKKETLDELIRIIKKYHKTGDTDLLPKYMVLGNELAEQAFSKDNKGVCFRDLVSSIYGGFGLNQNATNETVYEIFNLLGISVEEDEKGAKK